MLPPQTRSKGMEEPCKCSCCSSWCSCLLPSLLHVPLYVLPAPQLDGTGRKGPHLHPCRMSVLGRLFVTGWLQCSLLPPDCISSPASPGGWGQSGNPSLPVVQWDDQAMVPTGNQRPTQWNSGCVSSKTLLAASIPLPHHLNAPQQYFRQCSGDFRSSVSFVKGLTVSLSPVHGHSGNSHRVLRGRLGFDSQHLWDSIVGSSSADPVSPSAAKLWAGGTWSKAENPHRGDCVRFQLIRPRVFPLVHAKGHHHRLPIDFISGNPVIISSSPSSLVDQGFAYHSSLWLLASISILTVQCPRLASPALGSFFLHWDQRPWVRFSIPAPPTLPPSPAYRGQSPGRLPSFSPSLGEGWELGLGVAVAHNTSTWGLPSL